MTQAQTFIDQLFAAIEAKYPQLGWMLQFVNAFIDQLIVTSPGFQPANAKAWVDNLFATAEAKHAFLAPFLKTINALADAEIASVLATMPAP